MSRFIEVHISVQSDEEAALIARTLVERRLAASVHLVPIRSFYNWENILCDDSEILLILKTKDHLFRKHIIPIVKSLQSYEVSEYVALPIVDSDPDYLKWLDEQIVGE